MAGVGARHPRSSFYHSRPWLESLKRTYGYSRGLHDVTAGQRIKKWPVFCRIASWLTGRRIVSLPFSDHCEPLVDSQDVLEQLVSFLLRDFQKEHWNTPN